MSKQPVLHYFSLGRLGRGEVVRLFLQELGIQYENVYYEYGEKWEKQKDQVKLNLTGSLPVLEIDGHRLSQHVPILRYLSRRAGSYDGETNYEKFLVDAVSDVYIDWRVSLRKYLNQVSPQAANMIGTVPHAADFSDGGVDEFIQQLTLNTRQAAWVGNLTEANDKYKNSTAPRAIQVLESYYQESAGPYLLGDKITYADFAVYQIIDNDACVGSKPELPSALKKLTEAIKSRPSLKEYIAKRDAA